MAEFPGQGYPSHVPPQHAPRLQQRKRKQKPPASLSKLHRPLTRFYCNDCKKKFRSRILANRNNNAVQHYCSLYAKIITRKVDSHSNKCKGDHGMGPCVVKRTDTDPDSDGEDETKAAYYADKGKKRPSTRKKSGAYTKKRKRDSENENENDSDNNAKRQRIDEVNHNNNHNHNPIEQPGQVYYPPIVSGYNGYYNDNGYVQPQHGYNGQYGNYPAMHVYNGNGYHNSNNREGSPMLVPPVPPIMEHHSSTGSTPPMGIALGSDDNIQTSRDSIASRIGDDAPPPPPPLEAFGGMQTEEKRGDEQNNGVHNDLFVEVHDNTAGAMIDNTNGNAINERDAIIQMVDKQIEIATENLNRNGDNDAMVVEEVNNNNNNSNNNIKKESEEEEEYINDENTEEEEDDLPDLTVPCNSPTPKSNQINDANDNQQVDDDDDEEDDDDDKDLILAPPL